MRISDWSSDVCSSDLRPSRPREAGGTRHAHTVIDFHDACCTGVADLLPGGNMHRARQHAETRTRERRRRLAHEAARLMAEGGIRDYHQAKLKAATRLGIHDDASLPRNREIEDALREYQRLFLGDSHRAALRLRREAALRALEFFIGFDARLVGPVLDGTADANSPVPLQMYPDDAAAVQHGMASGGERGGQWVETSG